VLRRNKFFAINGNTYKKLYCSWNINDGGRAKSIRHTNNFGKWWNGPNGWKEKASRK
jgi:hypothetical protein